MNQNKLSQGNKKDCNSKLFEINTFSSDCVYVSIWAS